MWWMYVIVVAVLMFGIYAFVTLIGAETRRLTRRTNRTADSIYANYAGSKRAQQRSARRQRGE